MSKATLGDFQTNYWQYLATSKAMQPVSLPSTIILVAPQVVLSIIEAPAWSAAGAAIGPPSASC